MAIMAPRVPTGAAARPGRSMRSDIETMLMPFFPDEASATRHVTEIGGRRFTLYTNDPTAGLATPADRRVINLLAGRVADIVHAGEPPTRHLAIGVRELREAIGGDAVSGGADYARITERLHRLASTRIRSEQASPLGPDVDRVRDFAWVDAWQQDVRKHGSGHRVVGIRVSLSEDALSWILEAQGFMVSREDFADLTRVASSAFRIYEICLAQLLSGGGSDATISIDELRRRVPISSDLKIFKARTLRRGMDTIAAHPHMSRCLSLCLRRKQGDRYVRIAFGERAPLADIHVGISRGPDAPRDIGQIGRASCRERVFPVV